MFKHREKLHVELVSNLFHNANCFLGGFYRKFGSLQLLLSLNWGFTSSLPQILFPARFGFFINFLFLSEKCLLIALLHSLTDA